MTFAPHFPLSELRCKCGCEPPDEVLSRLEELSWNLEYGFRDALKMPIRIISGHRCAEHNADVGGAADSRHLYGDGADLSAGTLHGLWLAGFAEAQIYHRALRQGGLGTYVSRPGTLHYDMRGDRSRWRY